MSILYLAACPTRGRRGKVGGPLYPDFLVFSMEFTSLLFYFFIIIPSAIFHEYAHGWMADRLGDPTARYAGRLTLDPRPHIDKIGTLLLPLMLFVFTGGRSLFAYLLLAPFFSSCLPATWPYFCPLLFTPMSFWRCSISYRFHPLTDQNYFTRFCPRLGTSCAMRLTGSVLYFCSFLFFSYPRSLSP
ncbi:MAG: Transmembrane protein [Candidatus Magasanikbacteria bacterium GW2011_GWA2_56_11]|uniref:Transmembrane protein n=1 Tax=Candidatus Magasanikbacteria bacterium GW2011_GWA2_56_11 TaxID=1619044 RepID=A0A0G1YG97_9BACT|nr:MAG: Transmembrane protein [Candidatus Magasanikbacteria bacterium GW2011_GWA2_56_11]